MPLNQTDGGSRRLGQDQQHVFGAKHRERLLHRSALVECQKEYGRNRIARGAGTESLQALGRPVPMHNENTAEPPRSRPTSVRSSVDTSLMGPATRICRPEPRFEEARSAVRKNQDGMGRSTTIVAESTSNTLNEPGIDSGRASWVASPAAI